MIGHDAAVSAAADAMRPLPEAYLITDLRGVIHDANPAAERLMARSLASLLDTELASLLEDRGTLPELLGRWSSSGSLRPSALQLADGRRLRCDGARIAGQTLLLLWLRDQDRALQPFLEINDRFDAANLRELSRRLEASVAELLEANRRLTAARDEVQQYARAVAHDIRTPLFTLQGFAQLLEEHGHFDPKGAEYLRLIIEATARMGRTTDALLDVARVGSIPTTGSVHEPHAVLDQVLDDLRSETGSRDATICVGELLPVAVDESALRQVLQNLIGNSLRHGAVDGRPLRIDLSSRAVGASVEITIRDNGVGIDGEERQHLFELFYRGARAHDVPGQGIGLATCQKIIDAWGGTITCEPSAGACFTFTAPRISATG